MLASSAPNSLASMIRAGLLLSNGSGLRLRRSDAQNANLAAGFAIDRRINRQNAGLADSWRGDRDGAVVSGPRAAGLNAAGFEPHGHRPAPTSFAALYSGGRRHYGPGRAVTTCLAGARADAAHQHDAD